MADHALEREMQLREAAQSLAASDSFADEGAARLLPRKSSADVKQMLSLRVSARLVADLRRLATERGVTVTELATEALEARIVSGRQSPVQIWLATPMSTVGFEIDCRVNVDGLMDGYSSDVSVAFVVSDSAGLPTDQLDEGVLHAE